jgi:hypothetical protein
MGDSQTRTHSAISRVSRLCLRKIRFSRFAHSMLSSKTVDCISWLSGIAAKKSSRVRTGRKGVNWCIISGKHYALSLAVFALAVEDMNDLERVMISATPLAFLRDFGSEYVQSSKM